MLEKFFLYAIMIVLRVYNLNFEGDKLLRKVEHLYIEKKYQKQREQDVKEIWDGYHADESLAGVNLIRGEAIPNGIYHLVCDILVKHRDGNYLLMQRDFQKEGWPGKWEASAGGSALKGEIPLECANRELSEETGLQADTMTEINVCVSKETHSIYHTYLCETSQSKDSVILQKDETIAYKWITKEELIDFYKSGKMLAGNQERLKEYIDSLITDILNN